MTWFEEKAITPSQEQFLLNYYFKHIYFLIQQRNFEALNGILITLQVTLAKRNLNYPFVYSAILDGTLEIHWLLHSNQQDEPDARETYLGAVTELISSLLDYAIEHIKQGGSYYRFFNSLKAHVKKYTKEEIYITELFSFNIFPDLFIALEIKQMKDRINIITNSNFPDEWKVTINAYQNNYIAILCYQYFEKWLIRNIESLEPNSAIAFQQLISFLFPEGATRLLCLVFLYDKAVNLGIREMDWLFTDGEVWLCKTRECGNTKVKDTAKLLILLGYLRDDISKMTLNINSYNDVTGAKLKAVKQQYLSDLNILMEAFTGLVVEHNN
ncbi:MAG: hypothetical protein ACK4PR_09150 [Gammaproteobacteria bacterium]